MTIDLARDAEKAEIPSLPLPSPATEPLTLTDTEPCEVNLTPAYIPCPFRAMIFPPPADCVREIPAAPLSRTILIPVLRALISNSKSLARLMVISPLRNRDTVLGILTAVVVEPEHVQVPLGASVHAARASSAVSPRNAPTRTPTSDAVDMRKAFALPETAGAKLATTPASLVRRPPRRPCLGRAG